MCINIGLVILLLLNILIVLTVFLAIRLNQEKRRKNKLLSELNEMKKVDEKGK